MNKVVFLDRDGTINIDYGYVHELSKLTFLPGSLEALRSISEHGYKIIIVTNQSGIGRGIFTMEQYESFTAGMLERMEEAGVHVDRVYTCPHVEEDHCNCRKPKLGLFEEAIRDFDIDIPHSFAVGDRIRDLKICDRYPIRGIYLKADLDCVNHDDDAKEKELGDHIVMKASWKEIAEYICGEDRI
jgi:D-glycero-D-manno-heptose 1,7-bisphosphate phosphatase